MARRRAALAPPEREQFDILAQVTAGRTADPLAGAAPAAAKEVSAEPERPAKRATRARTPAGIPKARGRAPVGDKPSRRRAISAAIRSQAP